MSLIPQPSLGGKQPPFSIDLAAAGWSQHLAKRLIRFKSLGSGPERDPVAGREAAIPITDIDYWQGRWVLCPLRIESEKGEGMTFADAVVAASRENRIVSTALTGRNGTVKEYINAADWSLSIVLGLQHTGDTGEIADEWPEQELRRLRKLLETQQALLVQSEFLDALQISRIVIRSYSVQQMTEANYQVVTVSAVSDEEYQIFSNEY